MSDTTHLDQALLERHPDSEPPGEAWTVTDADRATWASRKLQAAHEAIAAAKAWQERECDRIREIAAADIAEHQRTIDFFEWRLGQYLEAQISAGSLGDKRSIKLAGGTIQRRKQPEKVTLEPEAFLAWAKEHAPEFVRVKEEPALSDLKAAAALAEDGVLVVDGQPVAGATWEAQPDKVSFAPAKRKESAS